MVQQDVPCLVFIRQGTVMRALWIFSGLLALSLTGCASPGAAAPESGQAEASAAGLDAPPHFSARTGTKAYIYHQVWGDCAMLDHGVGRNYAWGRHRMPLNAVSHVIIEDGIHFTCKDRSDCIEVGKLEDTPGRVSEHTVPFESRAFAEAYLAEVADLRAACKAVGDAS
jgi:hypothetical protein